MGKIKLCTAPGCFSCSRQRGLKFCNCPRDSARYVCFNTWISMPTSHMRIVKMFHKLKKVTLMTSSCSAETTYHVFICSCMKPLVSSTSTITLSSSCRDYVQETYSELQRHLFHALQTFLSSQYIRILLSENGQSSFCSLSTRNYISVENYVRNCVVTHMVLVYVGRHEVALLYNWLAVFRLLISAWNT
jgi:hypothetical protein